MTVTFTRPDGRTYRPRNPSRRILVPLDAADGTGACCLIIGTLDPTEAKGSADALLRWVTGDTTAYATNPQPGWWRDGYGLDGRAWVVDDRRGRPGIMFDCEYE